jgi:hypothetical protein
MAPERTRQGPWLFVWVYMVITLVVPLALGATGVWAWDVGMGVASGFWVVSFIVMAVVPEIRSARGSGRRKKDRT